MSDKQSMWLGILILTTIMVFFHVKNSSAEDVVNNQEVTYDKLKVKISNINKDKEEFDVESNDSRAHIK